MGAQLYSQALGSISVAFYDVQGYGGGLNPPPNGIVDFQRITQRYIPEENTLDFRCYGIQRLMSVTSEARCY
jgi:hypothetical protein